MDVKSIWVVVVAGCLLAGCQSYQPISSNSEPSREQPTGHEAPSAPEVQPVIDSLVRQGQQKLRQSSWHEAINIAEQGLRIERRSSRLYMILSKSYEGLGQRQQAISFARQALRYCVADCRAEQDWMKSLR